MAAKRGPENRSAAELLAEWRAAGRDVVAARAAAKVAERALEAATAAEQAANAVDDAARGALDAVAKARALAATARSAANEAAHLAASILEGSTGDKARASQDVAVAERAEKQAEVAFHDAEAEGFPKS